MGINLFRFHCMLIFISSIIHISRQHHFTIVSESHLFTDRDFNALLTIHDTTDELLIKAQLIQRKSIAQRHSQEIPNNSIDIKGPHTIEKQFSVNTSGSHLIQLSVPSDWPAAYYKFTVVISDLTGPVFNQTQDVFLRGPEQQRYDFIFMLDKDNYITGDTVSYSILILDQRGKAIKDDEIIKVQTLVTDGVDVLISQQLNATTKRGIHRGEINLVKDCSNGVLDIIVNYKGQIKSKSIALQKTEIRDDLNMQLILTFQQTNDLSQVIAKVHAYYKCGVPIGGNLTVLLKEVAGLFPLLLPGPDDHFCLQENCTKFEIKDQNFYSSQEINVPIPKIKGFIGDHASYILYVKLQDELTGRSRWTWKPVEPNFSDRVEIIVEKKYFSPGLPLHFSVKINNNLGLDDFETEKIKLKIRAKYLDFSNDKKEIENEVRNFSLPNLNDELSVAVTPTVGAIAVILQVEIENRIYARKLIRNMPYNAANNSLIIIAENQLVHVGSNLSVDIYATADLNLITYQVTSIRSYSIVHWGSAKLPDKGPLRLEILVTQDFVSHFYLNVYGVSANGEFVADNQHFITVEENPLQLQFEINCTDFLPGAPINLTIKTKPNTMLLLKAWNPVEKTLEFRQFDNNFLQFLEVPEERVWSHWKKREGEEVELLEMHTKWSNSAHLQSRLFTPPRLSLITNANLQNVPSKNQSYRIPPTEINLKPQQGHKRVSFLRKWLWKLIRSNDEGLAVISTNAPDQISVWTMTLMGVDDAHNIGHIAVPSIQVTKPLFLLMDIPESLIRGEAVLLRVLVFQETRANVNVTISSVDKRFQLLDRFKHKVLPTFTERITLKSNDTRFNVSHGDLAEFIISPLYSGRVSIEATVIDDNGNQDIIVRTINVKDHPTNELPFVYEAKEALRFEENIGCQQPDVKISSSSSDDRLNISFQVNSVNDQIGNLKVNACVWYYKQEKSNFILDLNLPSGFEVPTDIENVTGVIGIDTDDYTVDIIDGRVRWRFTYLQSDDVFCMTVIAKRVFMVYNLKSAKVTAYTSFDLNKAKRAGVFYKAPSFALF